MAVVDKVVDKRGTRAVAWITAAMMVVEVAAGWWFNSMALLADGWHMSSHVVAIGLSAAAYAAARRYAGDPRFAFGTWKIEVLAGFASAVFLIRDDSRHQFAAQALNFLQQRGPLGEEAGECVHRGDDQGGVGFASVVAVPLNA